MSKSPFAPPTADEQTVLEQLTVRWVTAPKERARCRRLLREHHYLQSSALVGEQLLYVAEYRGQWLALLAWNAAAKHLQAREAWIGWRNAQRQTRLPLVANNSRFCILPQCHYPNLASRSMRLCLDRLSDDWQAAYGHPIAVVESFVDPQLFRGTAYKASGWTELGLTKGFGRAAQDYYTAHARPKALWVRELAPGHARRLAARTLSPAWASVEKKARGCPHPVQDLRALYARFQAVPDWRGRRIKTYPVPGLLAMVALATLSGVARGQRALAAFARKLTQPQLRALGVRRDRRPGRFPAPGATMFFRLLTAVDPERIQPLLLAWQEQVLGPLPPEEDLLVVDGKALHSSQGAQIVSVIGARRQRWLGSQLIAAKSNEIPAARRLLEPFDLVGKTVVLDALHTQRETAQQIVFEQGGDYLLTVKGNQKGLQKTIHTLLHPQGFPPSPAHHPERRSQPQPSGNPLAHGADDHARDGGLSRGGPGGLGATADLRGEETHG